MSFVRKEGKDTIIFASKEDHASPSKVDLPEPEPSPGLILANGEINWNCPCLGGMATGPCGLEFREAFSCFHYSNAEPKGSDCYEAFKTMQTCMSEYPALYGNREADMDAMEEEGSASIANERDSPSDNGESHSIKVTGTKQEVSAAESRESRKEVTHESSGSKKEVEQAKAK